MRKRKLYKLIAVVTALGMIAVSPMTALAEPVGQVTVEGTESKEAEAVSNDTADTGVSMTDGADTLDGKATVTGDVSVSNKDATRGMDSETNGVSIESNGGKATVNVGGNVTADASKNDESSIFANGVSTGANATIDIGGSVTASTNGETGLEEYDYYATAQGIYSGAANYTDPEYKADIHIGKDVNASSENGLAIGVSIKYNAAGSTTVDGDIDASGMYALGISINSVEEEYEAGKSIDISVGGNLEAEGTESGTGVYVVQNNKDLNITIEGDITGSTHGIYVKENSGNAKIVSGGTISSEEGAAIVVVKPTDDTKAPEVTAWKIVSGTENLVESDADYAKEFQSAINYIIKADTTENGSASSNGKIVLTGTKGTVTVGDKTYDTAHQDDTIIINVETAKGYKSTVQNNGTGVLTANADGTYTLTIPAGGGVDLRAVLEKIDISTRNSERYYSGGSGSSGGGSGAATVGSTYNGSWSQDATGWKAQKSNGSYANGEWCQFAWNGKTNWYHFNTQGYADGGWFTDTDGQKYYLYNTHDGNFGYMYTGWNQIDGLWYYFNTIAVNNGSLGSLVTNGTTPDGYKVDAAGAWVK